LKDWQQRVDIDRWTWRAPNFSTTGRWPAKSGRPPSLSLRVIVKFPLFFSSHAELRFEMVGGKRSARYPRICGVGSVFW